MKKQFAAILTATAVLGVIIAAMLWWLTPAQPTSYVLYTVRGGETLTSIINDANKNSKVDYDLREAIATAVAESKKMEGGAQGYLIKPGDKIAVPIYR